ncbi:unnamed protein product [Effrenium voratum]|uniref:Uncharacterized protein n=1 Tax=Effrenium voratum TaxID=2562239 RepID=A0AA36IER2_9DINO|nr:unnamed protein product [Effrenium voratum]CAJ1386301.1 unnamed protein product [Effrenium voratum]
MALRTLAAVLLGGSAKEIKVINQCQETLWLGARNLPLEEGQVEMKPNAQVSIEVESLDSGSLWARTGCSEQRVFEDCYKGLSLNPPCAAGSHFYCRDGTHGVQGLTGECQATTEGPFDAELCFDQCVITKEEVPDKDPKPVRTPEGHLSVGTKFHCATGDCAKPRGADAGSKFLCGAEEELRSAATLVKFSFQPGEEDIYDLSLVEGFNVNVSLAPSAKACRAASCSLDPWTQCQTELMDFSHETQRPFCWSIKSALTSSSVRHKYSFMEKWTDPKVSEHAGLCKAADGSEHYCHDVLTCSDGCDRCRSQVHMDSSGGLCCSPNTTYTEAEWPAGPPYAHMCNVTSWPKSPLDKASYVENFRRACPEASAWPLDRGLLCARGNEADYEVVFCPEVKTAALFP